MKLKPKTSLVVFASVAFLQFASGVALAYYNPQTGCWLSRDPVVEPGFQLVQQASGRPPGQCSPRPCHRGAGWSVNKSATESVPTLTGLWEMILCRVGILWVF